MFTVLVRTGDLSGFQLSSCFISASKACMTLLRECRDIQPAGAATCGGIGMVSAPSELVRVIAKLIARVLRVGPQHGADRLGTMAPSARSSGLSFSKLGYFVLDLLQPFSTCQMLLLCRTRVFITSFELALQQQIYFRSQFF